MNYISAQEIPILVDTPLADTVTNTKNTPPAVTDDIALFPTTEPLPVVPTGEDTAPIILDTIETLPTTEPLPVVTLPHITIDPIQDTVPTPAIVPLPQTPPTENTPPQATIEPAEDVSIQNKVTIHIVASNYEKEINCGGLNFWGIQVIEHTSGRAFIGESGFVPASTLESTFAFDLPTGDYEEIMFVCSDDGVNLAFQYGSLLNDLAGDQIIFSYTENTPASLLFDISKEKTVPIYEGITHNDFPLTPLVVETPLSDDAIISLIIADAVMTPLDRVVSADDIAVEDSLLSPPTTETPSSEEKITPPENTIPVIIDIPADTVPPLETDTAVENIPMDTNTYIPDPTALLAPETLGAPGEEETEVPVVEKILPIITEETLPEMILDPIADLPPLLPSSPAETPTESL